MALLRNRKGWCKSSKWRSRKQGKKKMHSRTSKMVNSRSLERRNARRLSKSIHWILNSTIWRNNWKRKSSLTAFQPSNLVTWNGRSSTTSLSHWSPRVTLRVVWHPLSPLETVKTAVILLEGSNLLSIKETRPESLSHPSVQTSRRHLKHLQQSKRLVSMQRKWANRRLVESELMGRPGIALWG